MGQFACRLRALFSQDIVKIGSLVLGLAATRIPFRAKYLYEWDSVQYALGMERFDVAWHRPHPPGYLFFILLARIVDNFVQDPNNSLILLSILLSVAALVTAYIIAKRIFNAEVALVACILLLFNPIFWFHGEVATIYAADAFAANLIGLACWLALSRGRHYLYISALILGLMGGLRQSVVLLLLPLWLFCIFSQVYCLKEILVAFVLLALGVLTWYVPTFVDTGGIGRYITVSRALSGGGIHKIDAFFGGMAQYYYSNSANILVWCLFALMPIGLVFVFLSLLLIKVRSFRNLLRIRPVGYFALWILGPLTFYFLAFIDKAGYLLVILAPIQIIIAKAILVVTSKLGNGHLKSLTKVISIITNVALCIIWFVFPAQADGMPTKIERPASLHHPPMSDYNWDISHRAIVVEDNQMDIVSKLLSSQSLLGYGPQTTVLVYTDGKPRWRKLMYYFPEYYTYWLVDETNSGMPEFGTEVYVGYQRKEDSYSGLAFWLPGERPNIQVVCLPSKTQNILWFVSKHSVFLRELSNDSLISGYLRIDDSEWSLPYIHLDAMHTLTVSSFIFVRNEHVTGHKCQ